MQRRNAQFKANLKYMNSIHYSPLPWAQLNAATRIRCQRIDALLSTALKKPSLSYEQLSHFTYAPANSIAIRDEIRTELIKRQNTGYFLGQEKICMQRAIAEGLPNMEESVYTTACQLRRIFFKDAEPLRKFDVTIKYLPELHIPPPSEASPIFLNVSKFSEGPAIFGALQLYLIILSVHPFSDGNGRVARTMFNLHLKNKYDHDISYLPLAELSKLKNGVYEELLARAIIDGKYLKIFNYMLDIIIEYVRFMRTLPTPTMENDVTRSYALAASRVKSPDPTNPNSAPPYFISIKNVLECKFNKDINYSFFHAIISIENELKKYGQVKFALSCLDQLTENGKNKINSLTFFLKIFHKEELILRARQLRARHGCIENIQFAEITGDALLDAKILINNSAQYSSKSNDHYHCPVILHDFTV